MSKVAQNSRMTRVSAESTDTDDAAKLIAFEHPLTERMRTFLRIELLQRQAGYYSADPSEFATRAAIASLLEMLTITGRGDVRSDALQELDRHLERLAHYRKTPGIDEARLTGLLENLEALRAALASAGKQYLSGLRENEFLSAILHRSAIPGGTCVFDLPEYGYWLQTSAQDRATELNGWLDQFRPLNDAIAEVLWLTREANTPQTLTAPGGFYQHSLARKERFQLVRVLVDRSEGIYPRISAGQHRFTIYFMEWEHTGTRTHQTERDVSFQLALC